MKKVFILFILFLTKISSSADENVEVVGAWIAFSSASQKLGVEMGDSEGFVDPAPFKKISKVMAEKLELLVKLRQLTKQSVKFVIPEERDLLFEDSDQISELTEIYGLYSMLGMTGLLDYSMGEGRAGELYQATLYLPEKEVERFKAYLKKKKVLRE